MQQFSVTSGITIPAAATPTFQPLGANLNPVNYYNPDLPFINLVKSAGAGNNYWWTGWETATSIGGTDTAEEGALTMDSDGYPTHIPQSGLTGTLVYTIINILALAPTATYKYPSGTYRLQFTGTGTVQVTGDGSLTLSNAGTGTVNQTFPVTPSGGMKLAITSSDPSSTGNYVKNISLVLNSNAAAYDAGAIFNPDFLAALGNYTSIRFMEWTNAWYGRWNNISTGATILSGATGGTYATYNYGTSAWDVTNWPGPTTAFNVFFSNGDARTITMTYGSSAMAWSTGLSSDVVQNGTNGQAIGPYNTGWANRAVPSNCFWSLNQGPPYEVCVALCNAKTAHCYIPVPQTFTDSEISSLNTLVLSGSGSYAGLSSPLLFFEEWGNEVWNTQSYSSYGSNNVWPSQSGQSEYARAINYQGYRTAQMATLAQTAWGASFSRCIPIMGGQMGGASNWNTIGMATPFWVTDHAYNHPIKAAAGAPYMGDYGMTATDKITMLSQSDGGYADFYATFSSQVGASGYTYTSIPVGGWLGQVAGWITDYTSMLAADYPTLTFIGYEWGFGFTNTDAPPSGNTASGGFWGGISNSSAWQTLYITASRSSQMGTIYTSWMNQWKSLTGGATLNTAHHHYDCYTPGGYGAWGVIESVMQTLSPLSSAPYRYQSIMNYIG